MKACGILVLFLAGSLVVRADDDTVTLPEMLQGAQQWAQENLDTNVLPRQINAPEGYALKTPLPLTC
jgi:hypothetical protein